MDAWRESVLKSFSNGGVEFRADAVVRELILINVSSCIYIIVPRKSAIAWRGIRVLQLKTPISIAETHIINLSSIIDVLAHGVFPSG